MSEPDHNKWTPQQVYEWAIKQKDGKDYAQALLDKGVRGEHLHTLNEQKLLNNPFNIDYSPTQSLLSAIEELCKSMIGTVSTSATQ
eukprot:gene18383-21996_t